MNLEEIVQELIKKEEIEWEDIIDSLIANNYLNPTDIDLNLLVDYYIKIVRELKNKENFDFVLTSKVLLLLVFFLKLKIEYLSKEIYGFEENEEDFIFEENEEFKEKREKKRKNKKKLEFIIKLDRKRKVDLEDLKKAIKEALKDYEEKKKKLVKRKKEKDLEDLKKLEYDIEKEIVFLSKKLEELKEKIIKFSLLLNNLNRSGKEETIRTFMPLLYLDSQDKIELKQENPFNEIFIIKK